MQFGKYALNRKIATGGMAETWLGSFTGAAGVSKTVVVKRIRPELAGDPEFVRMFINEARIAVSFSHGNIAQVFDFGEVDGEYFLAMEFVDGPTLSKVLKRAHAQGLPALPIPFALYVALRMCEGLHYAHTRTSADGKRLAFIHRDVSPQNVIVGIEGEVKLIDFGIAKAVTDTRNLTTPGVWKGKLLYASPEQMRTEPLDPRTDVYSTGVVLYEMLCGELPYGGQHAGEVLGRIERQDFKRPVLVNPDIPKPLEDVLLVAMAPRRDDRFPDAKALQDALQRQLYGIAPTFGAATLGQLMAWLYADDLKARARTVELPQEFVEQLSIWRKAATSRNTGEVKKAEEGGQTVAERSRSRQTRPTYGSLTRPHDDAAQRRSRTVILAAVAVVLVLAGLFTAGAWVQLSRATLQLASVPPGASVRLGGVPQAGVTPLEVKVTPNEAIEVELSLPGYRPYRDTRVVPAGSTASLEAALVPIPPPKPEEPPPTPVVEPRVAEPAGPKHEIIYPVDAAFELTAQAHGLKVPGQVGALKIELEPKARYAVSTDGAFTFAYGWRRGNKAELVTVNVDTVPYVLEANPPRFGELTGRPLEVTGATALWVFLVDNGPLQRRGAVHVVVKGGKDKRPRTFPLDPRVNALRVDGGNKLVVRRLDDRLVYRLTLEADGAEKGGRVLCAQRTAGRPIGDPSLTARVHRIVEVGKPVTLARTAELECFFPLGEGPAAFGPLKGSLVSLGVPKEDLDDAFNELSSRGRVSLWGIGFESASATLLPEAERLLQRVKARLEKEPRLDLVIEGHTDDVGGEVANRQLSQARAEAVRAWLVAHGVAKERLSAEGHGEERPIADNALEEGRALNRRVDLVKR